MYMYSFTIYYGSQKYMYITTGIYSTKLQKASHSSTIVFLRYILWSSSSVDLEFDGLIPSFASQSSTTYCSYKWLSFNIAGQVASSCPSLSSCVHKPGIAWSWVNPGMASGKCRSTLCAGQSTDCANPCFAPSIYTVHVHVHVCTCSSIHVPLQLLHWPWESDINLMPSSCLSPLS